MQRKIIIISVVCVFLLIAASAVVYFKYFDESSNGIRGAFSEVGVLEETGKIKNSKDDFWWLNSGGVMTMNADSAKTNFGALSKGSFWQKRYAKANSRDTDDGYYPQNIFRLVNRGVWKNFTQQLYFNIDTTNLSDSSFRDASNGVLLFNRYQDGDNLYYVGVRVDGHAVIKKKIADKYYTMAEKAVFSGGKKYDRDNNPNLLPIDSWIGIRSEVRNVGGDTVNIKLYMDKTGTGKWQLVLETEDTDDKYGAAPFLKEGHAGIRTDFMDVAFKDYSIE